MSKWPMIDKGGNVIDKIEAPDAETAKAMFLQKRASGAYGEQADPHTNVGRETSLGDQISRKASSVAAGLRDIPEGIAGMAGDMPGALGGITKWLGEKLPDHLVSPEAAARAGEAVKYATGAPASEVIIKSLLAAGIISPDTAQSLYKGADTIAPDVAPAPTSEQVHKTVSSYLPEGVDRFTSGPENPTETEENIRFGTGLLSNLIGGPKPSTIAAASRRFGTRVAAPTVVETAIDPITEKLIAEGHISEQDAVAMKTFMQGVTGGGGGMMEKGLDRRSAVAQISRNPKAVQAIYDALISDGLNPAAARARIAELGGGRAEGGNAMIVDLGTHGNIEQLGVQSARSGTEGGATLKRELTERGESTGERITADKSRAFGSPVDRGLVEERFNKRLKTVGGKMTEAKLNQQRPVEAQDIIDEIDSDLAVIKDPEAIAELEKIRSKLHLRGTDQLDPSAEGLHGVRRMIDSQFKTPSGAPRDMGAEKGRVLTKYRKLIDPELKDAAPRMKTLDKQYSSISKEREAFETGQQALKKSGEITQPAGFKRVWDSMSPRERQNVVQGASSTVSDMIGLTDRERTKLKTTLGGEYNEAKLRTMLGDEKTDALLSAMEREDLFKARESRIVHNSVTADALNPNLPGSTGSMRATDAGTMTLATTASPTAAIKATALTAVRNKVGQWLDRSNASQQLKSEIGGLLASDDPGKIFQAMERLKKVEGAPGSLTRAMQTALMARMAETGHR